jgi:anti-sigma-K factor RskA
MTTGGHFEQEDLALYAMHGSTPAEAALVRAHLAECPACRTELEKISTDLAMVAMSVEQHPLPEGARQRFVDRLAELPAPAAPVEIISIRSEQPKRRAAVWIPWSIAAVMALVAVLVGLANNSLQHELAGDNYQIAQSAADSQRAQKVLDVLTAPEAHHVVLTASKVAHMPTARAVYLASRGGLILEASNMGPLPADKTYELWVIPANGAPSIPAGTFRPDAAGNASLILPDLPVGIHAKAFGVTIERAEGSPTPTLPIIMAGTVPTS